MPLTEQQLRDNFTADELAAMGETVAEPQPEDTKTEDKGPETPLETGEKVEPKEGETSESETEPVKEEKKEEEEETFEEGKPVPYSRFAKIYGRAKTAERAALERDEYKEKLELFKTDPESYFEKYPDERPEEKSAPEKPSPVPSTPVKVKSFKEMLGAVINDPANPDYHGQPLKNLMQLGPEGIAAAYDYYEMYKEDARQQAQEAKAKDEAIAERIKARDNSFLDSLARDTFQKPLAILDKTESAKIEGIRKQVLAWMKKNDKLAMDLEDAYIVMNKDELIKKAKETGAKAAIDHTKAASPRSASATVIDNGKKVSVYDQFADMDKKAMVKAIDGMTDAQFAAFRKNAPDSFKKKFPEIPW